MDMGGTGNAEFYPIEPAFNYLAAGSKAPELEGLLIRRHARCKGLGKPTIPGFLSRQPGAESIRLKQA
jgi:hypothetical protein